MASSEGTPESLGCKSVLTASRDEGVGSYSQAGIEPGQAEALRI